MVRTLLVALAAGMTGMALGAAHAAEGGLDALRWNKRVVVAFAPSGDAALIAEQKRIIASQDAAERDLVLVAVEGDEVVENAGVDGLRAAALREDFSAAPDERLVALVGKDGGIKLRHPGVLDARTLDETIDAMPMRRREAGGG